MELPLRAQKIAVGLAEIHPNAHCALVYRNPLELLIATIMAAQCTDKLVNTVTPALFEKYPDARAFAEANPKELQTLIQRVSFFRTKARNVILCCQQIVARHNGEVPRTMEELVQLRGVGRKTANVVLGNAFGVPGIPVDTHVRRVSKRMGLTVEANPVKIESDLNNLLPEKEWIMFTHRMIFHGRQVCHARKPQCEQCGVNKLCPKLGVK